MVLMYGFCAPVIVAALEDDLLPRTRRTSPVRAAADRAEVEVVLEVALRVDVLRKDVADR